MTLTNDILARLAVINQVIADAGGGAFVPTEPPRAMNPGNMPIFVSIPGKTLERQVEQDCKVRLLREWHVRLYACSVAKGSEGEAMAKCLPFFDLIPEEYDSRPSMVVEPTYPNPPTGVKRLTVTGDAGLAVMPWGNAAYLGLEAKLNILAWTDRVKASGN